MPDLHLRDPLAILCVLGCGGCLEIAARGGVLAAPTVGVDPSFGGSVTLSSAIPLEKPHMLWLAAHQQVTGGPHHVWYVFRPEFGYTHPIKEGSDIVAMPIVAIGPDVGALALDVGDGLDAATELGGAVSTRVWIFTKVVPVVVGFDGHVGKRLADEKGGLVGAATLSCGVAVPLSGGI